MELLERGLLPEPAEAGADAADVRVHGHVALAEREQEHAGGRLAADAGERGEAGAALLDRGVPQAREVVAVELAQDRLDAHGLDLRDAPGPDRRLDLLVGRVAYGLPAAEAVAQPQEGHVAVAVVGRLGQDGEDQLVQRLAVRRRDRRAVELAQAVADPADASRRDAHRADATWPGRGFWVPGSG